MIIQDNVIKHYLKNVYFVSGNACGGKTTMSRLLAEKYGFALYDMDAMYEKHRDIARPMYQPDMCYHMKDHHQQWTRPTEEQARWNINSLHEQTDMVLMDLIKLSGQGPVVADVLFSSVYQLKTVDYHRLAFLTVDKSLIRKLYFNRPEKRGFYEYVARQPLADLYFENIFSGLERTNELEQAQMKESGLFVYERKESDTPAQVLEVLERHFGLIT